MIDSSVFDLVRRSSFVFSGTVVAPVGSSLRVLPPRAGLAVVRFERGFLVNPVLGDLEGRPITVRLAQEGAGGSAVRAEERLLFFTTAWVHGEEIAVSELSRLTADDKNEQEVAQVVASLPQVHLRERVDAAQLIVHGTVTDISFASDIAGTGTEHDPGWTRATIEVQEVVKGTPGQTRGPGRRPPVVVLMFPDTEDRAFLEVPRPFLKQTAVFLLHPVRDKRLPEGSLEAPDPADIQPETQLPAVRQLVGPPPSQPRRGR